MQLRSIPPQTMNGRARKLTGTIAQERAAQLRRNLMTLRDRLQKLAMGKKEDLMHQTPPMQLSFGGVGAHAVRNSTDFDAGKKTACSRSRKSSHPVDYLVPSRRGPNRQPVVHTVTETADAQIIRITFPVPVRSDEVAWELHGDVLEVEYLGAAFTYYHAFLVPLVPTEDKPILEGEDRSFTFRFPTNACQRGTG